jgi:YHS domain-containing protein
MALMEQSIGTTMISSCATVVRRVTAVLGIGFALLPAPSIAFAEPTASCTIPSIDARQVCAVENVLQAHEGIPCEHDGKTYWVCCPRCVQAFKDNPDAYRLATDPVSGAQVDKATALVQAYAGRVFFFASEATRAAFNTAPDRWAQ